MPNELALHQGGEISHGRDDRQPTPMEMIAAIARDPSIPIDRITALIGLQERMETREAEKAFNRDFAAAMIEMPRVAKLGKKDMREKGVIPFARYEDVDAAIRPIESRHGFARSFSTLPTDKGPGLMMTLTLTHLAGHCLTSQRHCPPDPGPGRNDIQAQGSGDSYGRRYLTLALWNIVTVGADDDGDSADPITEEQALDIRDWIKYLALEPPKLAKIWAWIGPPAVSPDTVQRGQYEKLAGYLRGLIAATEKSKGGTK